MSDEEKLREWFIRLSDMVGGDLNEGASLADGLEWFGEISEDDLATIKGLGEGNSSISDFLELGQALMKKVGAA